MKHLERYEKLIEEFSYKSYQYVGDTIKIDINESGGVPVFVMKRSDLEGKLDTMQKNELNSILEKAMKEVVKYKEVGQNVNDYLGWNCK